MKTLLSLFVLALLSSCSPLQLDPGAQTPIEAFKPTQPIRVALVLGGGGARGLAHLGAIQELEAAGIRPDLIIGCSAGAMAGAIYADQPTLEGVPEAMLTLKKADLLDYTYFRPLFGLIEGESLQKYMQKTLKAKTFADLKIPLIVVATDLISGEVIELCHGDIGPAVRASCAFPGYFKPMLLHGRYLVDGGAACPIPVSIAKKYGAQVVIAIDLSEKLSKAGPRHLFGVTKRSLEIAYKKFVEQSLQQADVAVSMHFDEVGIFVDHMNEMFFQHGRETMQKHIAEIRDKVRSTIQESGVSDGNAIPALAEK